MIYHTIEIDFDTCTNVFGQSPCTASNAFGFECYNTKFTCQDEANFVKGTKTLYFSEEKNAIIDGHFPCIKSIGFAPTQRDDKKGLSYLGKLNVVFTDFPSNDFETDPYVARRRYIATDQGTFWGKLLARSPHHFSRRIRVKAWDDGVLQDEFLFVIDSISQPSSTGEVSLVAKDPLFLAGNEKAKAPAVTDGTLASSITDSSTSLTVNQEDQYPASGGVIAISKELIRYASRSGNTLNGLSRGIEGTEAKAHDSGAKVQLCVEYANSEVHDIVADLLTNFAGVDSSFIDDAEWQAEFNTWLQPYVLSRIIYKPTDVLQLISELQVQCGMSVFWDQRDQKIKLLANVPRTQRTDIETLTDQDSFVESMSVKELTKERVSQVHIYFNKTNIMEDDDEENFANLEVRADLNSEGETEFDSQSIFVIRSNWLNSNSQAGQVASRILGIYSTPPKEVSFKLSRKDRSLRVGDHFFINTASIQSKTGAPIDIEMSMMSMRYMPASMNLECKAQTFTYLIGQIFAFVADNSTPEFSLATEIQKQNNAFIAENSGDMSDGTEAYLII